MSRIVILLFSIILFSFSPMNAYAQKTFTVDIMDERGKLVPQVILVDTDQVQRGGIIWASTKPLGLDRLAQLCAPILWFSSDEPLFFQSDTLYYGMQDTSLSINIPQSLPVDSTFSQPVVYYRFSHIPPTNSRKEVEWPVVTDSLSLNLSSVAQIDYFFYYPRDIGFSPHYHDLEKVSVTVLFQKIYPQEYYVVQMLRVSGSAHGIRSYSNTLDVTKDTSLPVSILVEEGKHASCPDRNADGVYSPGYDVNVNVSEAWGCRDILGSNVLTERKYRAEMNKPRKPYFRLYLDSETIKMDSFIHVYRGPEEKIQHSYILRQITTDLAKEWKLKSNGTKKLREFYNGYLKRHKFTVIPDVTSIGFNISMKIEQFHEYRKLSTLLKVVLFPYGILEYGFRDYLTTMQSFDDDSNRVLDVVNHIYLLVAFRYDDGPGIRIFSGFPTIHLNSIGGSLVGVLNMKPDNVNTSFNILYARSTAGWFDWYVMGGRSVNGFIDKSFTVHPVLFEGGVKLRFQMPKLKLFTGIRLGIKTEGIKSRNSRFVFEIGSGVF